MSLIMKQAITGPAAWKGADMVGDTSWLHALSPQVLATLDAALAHVKAKGLTFPHFGRKDFPIGDWAQPLKFLAPVRGPAQPVAHLQPPPRQAQLPLPAPVHRVGPRNPQPAPVQGRNRSTRFV
jgi:hypothetical protein